MERYAWFPILLHSQYTFSSGLQMRKTNMAGDNRNYTRFSSHAKNIEYSLIDCTYFPYLTECLNKKPSKSVQLGFFILFWCTFLSSKMEWITFYMQVLSCKLYKSSKAPLYITPPYCLFIILQENIFPLSNWHRIKFQNLM